MNIDELLEPVSAEAPAGANLEYSPEFAELERTAAGKPERQVGATVTAAEDPDWKALVAQATALLRNTKDLRVANYLARALLRVSGYAGFGDGLELLRGLVDRHWAVLHPQLDPDDDNDPTFRVNAMASLVQRDVLQAVRAAPLLSAKGFGAVALRDIEATGGPAGQAPSAESATIEAVFHQAPLPELAEATRIVERCSTAARELATAWGAVVETAGPDFTELRRLLTQASQFMKTRLEQRQPPPDEGAPAEDGTSAAGAAPTGGGLRGEPRSREDVLRALDAICAYYTRHEPSSPVPLLLDRCKRLVTMSFLDIVKDMLPDGVSTIHTIVGKPQD